MERYPRSQNLGNAVQKSPDEELYFTKAEIIDGQWMEHALCRTIRTEVFFPSDGHGVEIAKAICRDCVVKDPCLEYALINDIKHGVWGGTSERERSKLAKRYKAS